MSTFGGDIGAILRSSLAPLAKLTAAVVRYHAPDGADAKQIAEVSGVSRSTTFELLNELGKAGVAEKRGGRWHHSSPPHGLSPVRHTDSPVRHTDSPVRHTDSPVRHTDSPPAPPNREIQTFSRPSPDESAAPARDSAAEKLDGHPLLATLLPLARAAVEIVGVCPEVFTLEDWHRAGWSIGRVRFGLQQAKQAAHAGTPPGRILTSARSWMLRATDDEIAGRAPQATSPTQPAQVAYRSEGDVAGPRKNPKGSF